MGSLGFWTWVPFVNRLGSLLCGSGFSESPGQGLCCTHKVLSLEKLGLPRVLVSSLGVIERLVTGVEQAVKNIRQLSFARRLDHNGSVSDAGNS